MIAWNRRTSLDIARIAASFFLRTQILVYVPVSSDGGPLCCRMATPHRGAFGACFARHEGLAELHAGFLSSVANLTGAPTFSAQNEELYGTTPVGGSAGFGRVFELTQPGARGEVALQIITC